MYSTLKKVHGAVSKRGVSSVLKMLRINKGKVIGTNGSLTIGATITELEHLDVTLDADKFLKAVAIADESNLKITVTTTGRVKIASGKFKAFIPTVPNDRFPMSAPEGELIKCEGLLPAIKAVSPFIGDDAIRKWSNGCLITNKYVYATNNVTLVRYNVKMDVPSIVIPRGCVTELVRINKEPLGVVCDKSSITFIMDDEVWVKSSLIDLPWPDMDGFFERNTDLPYIPDDLLTAVESVLPFCEDNKLPKIHFSSEGVSTSEGALGSNYEGIDLPIGCFHASVLMDILPSITHIDFSNYPKPCPFEGNDGLLQGVLMGLIQ